MTPRVSVILPTYNREALLPQAMGSVLEQDFTDLELLLVDDGSTDRTEEAVRALQERDPRIEYIRLNENRGVYFARDIAWRRARGEYIAWADSDDQWLPGKLSLQVAALDQHPEIDILFGDYRNIDHIQNRETTLFARTGPIFQALPAQKIGENLLLIESGVEVALLKETFVSLPTALFRNSLVEEVGGFDIALWSSADLEYFWRAALLGARFAYHDCLVMDRHKFCGGITADQVASWKGVLIVLARCELWAEKTGREDLFPPLQLARQRAARNLMTALGRQGQRQTVLTTFWWEMGWGVSARLAGTFLLALCGPGAIRLVEHWRRGDSGRQSGR
jgi:glycosyltransferase involved in cell wall biosynthesis